MEGRDVEGETEIGRGKVRPREVGGEHDGWGIGKRRRRKGRGGEREGMGTGRGRGGEGDIVHRCIMYKTRVLSNSV